MRVLFVGLENSYGRPEWGKAYEYLNFYQTLQKMDGVTSEFYATDNGLVKSLHEEVNTQLLRRVEEFKPDLVFFCLFTYELDMSTVASITAKPNVTTINWFTDDHWRFYTYSKKWAKAFSFVITTDEDSLPKYKAVGARAMLSQWAVNPDIYFPEKGDEQLGVSDQITFVGQKYGKRVNYFQTLVDKNLPIKFFGAGWTGGVVGQEMLRQIFYASAINLNFTESPYSGAKQWLKIFGKLFFKKQYGEVQLDLTGASDALLALPGYLKQQIKARIFEVPACGGFLLTGNASFLANYFIPGREIEVFNSKNELVEKARYYLVNKSERERIAKLGLERVLAQHIYSHRFRDIFKALGL